MDVTIALSQDKVSAMFRAVGFGWITLLEEGKRVSAVAAWGVPDSARNKAEEMDFTRWQQLVRLFQRWRRVSPSSLSPDYKQSCQEDREGREVMETSQGRIIKETEQALEHPSTSKRSNVRPKCPVLSHDSTFANISNICFPLCSLTCHQPSTNKYKLFTY